jgi:hypothetical protein
MAPKKKKAVDPATAAAEAARQRKAQADLMRDIKDGVFRWGWGSMGRAFREGPAAAGGGPHAGR